MFALTDVHQLPSRQHRQFFTFFECRSMSAKPAGKCCQRKGTPPDRLGIRFTLGQAIDYFNSIDLLMMRSYINAFTCSWYVSYMHYYSPVKIHETNTYFIRITPVYWSRMGRNRYVTNEYSPFSTHLFILLKVLDLSSLYELNNINPAVEKMVLYLKLNFKMLMSLLKNERTTAFYYEWL